MPQQQSQPQTPQAQQKFGQFRDITVQLEDGSIETFKVDVNTDQSRLPQVLEGAIRARQRIKKKQFPALPSVEPPAMFGDTIGENVVRGLKGAAEIPVGLAKDFIEGAQFVNRQPVDALKLLPEVVQGPIRNARQSLQRATGVPASAGFEEQLNRVVPSLFGKPASQAPGTAAEVVNAIPFVGPAATQFGERTAAGEGPEAVGNLTANVAASYAAAKGGQRMAQRITKPTPKFNVPIRPALAGQVKTALSKNPSLSPQVAGQLRKALANVPSTVTKPTRVRLPLVLGGRSFPMYIEVNSKILTHIKNFLGTANRSAMETFWMNRLLDNAVADDGVSGASTSTSTSTSKGSSKNREGVNAEILGE